MAGRHRRTRNHGIRNRGLRTRRTRSPFFPIVVVILGLSLTSWWMFKDSPVTEDAQTVADRSHSESDRPVSGIDASRADSGQSRTGVAGSRGRARPLTALAVGPSVALTTDRPEDAVEYLPALRATEKGANPEPTQRPVQTNSTQIASLVRAGDQALSRGEVIAARTHFSEAINLGAANGHSPLADSERSRLRGELTRLGNETVFSARILPGDPLVTRYTIKAGDTLGKIAKANNVSAELLATANGIQNVNMIRLGQVLKVVKGPFRAVIHKRDYSLDVYLGNTFVKHFKVGLGTDGSTPTGTWRVATKLKNPTYYPPRGGDIVSADDPTNPLGERWIALVGIDGEAIGQHRYGIHGTIEPESIGRSMSLGCVRMYNADVEVLYTYLVEQHSTVTILE